MNKFTILILIWLILNVLIVLLMDFALFMQTTDSIKTENIYFKILTTEFWASLEWLFIIPAQRIGILFLNPAQLALSSYVFDFLGQLWTNYYWLKLPTYLDDYIGMVLIFFGMYSSIFKIFD